MSPLSDAIAGRLCEPALLASLVDDAAVFPPGSAPLPDAVRRHRAHRASGYAACVGPLLVPASAAGDLVRLIAGEPLRVGVIGRPGTPGPEVAAAVEELRRADVQVAGVELGWTPDWRATDFGGLPLSLEVPRGDDQLGAIADIASAAPAASGFVAPQGKFRTGGTATWAWPDEAELAMFIRASIDNDLAFKLTGGLHHAVRGTHDGQEQHGLLNVLATVRSAIDGAGVEELVPVLAERDPAALLPQITRMSAADAATVRACFTAYGCCEVTDPIGELTTLGLVQGA